MKNVELVGKISEKLQNLLKQNIDQHQTAAAQVHQRQDSHLSPEINGSDAEASKQAINQEELLEELMRRATELRSGEIKANKQQQQATGQLSNGFHFGKRNDDEQTSTTMMIEQQQQQQRQANGTATQESLISAQLAAQLTALQQHQQHQLNLFTTTNNNTHQQQRQQMNLNGHELAGSLPNDNSLGPFDQQQAAQLAQRLAQQSQLQQQHSIENYLMRQRQQQLAQLEHLRTISSCSNESNSTSASLSGRHSSMGEHCFLEPLDHLMDCSTNQSQHPLMSQAAGQANRSLSPSTSCSLFSRLTRQLRLLESPSDSGVDSGKENGCGLSSGCQSSLGFVGSNGFRSVTPTSAGPSSTAGSACMSPINGLSAHHQHHLAMADALYHYAGHRAPSLSMSSGTSSVSSHIRNLTLSGLNGGANHHQNQQQLNSNNNHHQNLGDASPRQRQHQRPASAMSQRSTISRDLHQHHSSAGATNTSGSIEDMPMLKRALQAPPLINTNMLMDEAYRHHKKFRAAQRGRDHNSDQQAVCSTSGSSSAASNHHQRSGSASSSRGSPARSPSPTGRSSCNNNSKDDESTLRNASRSSNSVLADMHTTLLKKLSQPASQMSAKQLKCNDLISEIILGAQSDDDDEDDYLTISENGRAEPASQANGGESTLRARSQSTSAVTLKSRLFSSALDGVSECLQQQQQQQEQPIASPVPSGAVAPASSPVSNSSRLGECSPAEQPDARLSNLHNILISGPQKQREQADKNKLHLLGQLSHHLVDEDYIARRLLNSGAFKRHQQAHGKSGTGSSSSTSDDKRAAVVSPALTNQQPGANGHQSGKRHHHKGAHNHHRPSSSCASSASPSPTSSLSTLSPSPSSSSMSPDLGMISQEQLAASRHRQQPPSAADSPVVGHSTNHHQNGGSQQHRNRSAFSSACSSASSSPIPSSNRAAFVGGSTTNSPSCQQLSQISKLSLHCNSSNSNSSAAFVRQHALQAQGLAFGPAATVGSGASRPQDQCGNFGLLADVAIAAAEEQSRMESMLLVQQAAAVATASAQPIDLSKK